MSKLIDRIAKRLGYVKRESAGFPAARIDRLTADWTTSTLSSDGQLYSDLRTLRARSRALRDGNDYANKFIGMVKSGVLGPEGINLKMKARELSRTVKGKVIKGPLDERANAELQEAWRVWGKKENCTVTGTLTWRDVQNIAMEAVATDGEVLIRKVRGWDNPFGFALQILESDYLDIDKNEQRPNGNSIRMGVEVDPWHKPIAYWILRRNPNDAWWFSTTSTLRSEPIPAEDFIHAFLPRRPEQSRGWPWMATAMLRMKMLGAYQDGEVTAARVAACKMGFLETTGDTKYEGEDDGSGNKIMEAQPGSFETLPMGMKLSSWDPQHPNTAFGAFVKDCIRGFSAGLNVGYNSLANDFESVNFSSARYATQEEREFFKSMQQWAIDQICQPVFEEWLWMTLMNRAVNLPETKFDKFNAADWRGRRWSYINPVDEIKANNDAIGNGLTSRTRVLAEMNIDIEDVYQELKAEEDLADALDLVVPYHPFYYGQVSGKLDEEEQAKPGQPAIGKPKDEGEKEQVEEPDEDDE